jgi:hypothetical protein
MAKPIALLFFVVAACSSPTNTHSGVDAVSQDITQATDTEVAYCQNAGLCLHYGYPCCTGITKNASACTQTHQRCCRDSGNGCTPNANQCCWGSCRLVPSGWRCP